MMKLGCMRLSPKTKKPRRESGLCCVVAERTGLEPAPPCVTGRYSNQLNYRSAHYKPGNDLLSHSECYTTIGVTAFHFCVRYGYRWFNSTIFTRHILLKNLSSFFSSFSQARP